MMPLDITMVRRSTRANKYDGFKVSQPKDIRVTKSKVKPRVVPTVSLSANVPSKEKIMEETPIQMLQILGGTCGVPEQDLSPKRLLASLQEQEDSE